MHLFWTIWTHVLCVMGGWQLAFAVRAWAARPRAPRSIDAAQSARWAALSNMELVSAYWAARASDSPSPVLGSLGEPDGPVTAAARKTQMIDSPLPYVQVVVDEGAVRATRLGLLRGRLTRKEGKATHAEVDVMTMTDGGGLVFSGRTTLVPIKDVEALGAAAVAVFADTGTGARARA